MTTLILVRHGESVANRDGVFVGHIDANLSEKGFLQAEKTAQYIKEHYNPVRVYASDLKRAYNTGKATADLMNIEIIPDERLREIYAGKWEGNKFVDLKTLFKEDYEKWLNDIGNARCTEGESVKELGQRIMGRMEEIAKSHNGEAVVIATHATPVRVARSIIEYNDIARMNEVPWATNASVTVIEYNEGKWCVKEYGIDGHLSDFATALPKNV